MPVDVLSLWNFGNPAESEQKFRDAMVGASEEDRLVLQTQVARARGLQGDWNGAKSLVGEVLTQAGAFPEALARAHLELGRALCSPAHKAADVTEDDREAARGHYTTSFDVAKANRLDYLAVDALHMMTMVDPVPEDQIAWNEKALAYMEQSDQPQAKLWEGSLRNNLGYAYHLAGRYDDAIAEFEKSLAERERAGKEVGVRIAKWMIARTLRVKGELDRALEMQLALEREWAEAGDSDSYVFGELETLYRTKGDDAKADHYRTLAGEDKD